MPYHLEKGPVFATLETLYNDPRRLPQFLDKLRQGGADALGSLGLINSGTYDDKANPNSSNATGTKRRTSMLESWFGDDENGQRQHPFSADPANPPINLTTGYWSHYHGNVREIVAETLTRAAEVALGVDHPDPTDPNSPPTPTRFWPVEFFWKCGQARFEGWVTWREHGVQSGQVTVVFATPATPDLVLRRPSEGAVEAAGVRTDGWAKWQGVWVCSHADHQQWVMVTSWPTASGQWIVPVRAVMFTEGREDVGMWEPAFHNGGAAPERRPFDPATT